MDIDFAIPTQLSLGLSPGGCGGGDNFVQIDLICEKVHPIVNTVMTNEYIEGIFGKLETYQLTDDPEDGLFMPKCIERDLNCDKDECLCFGKLTAAEQKYVEVIRDCLHIVNLGFISINQKQSLSEKTLDLIEQISLSLFENLKSHNQIIQTEFKMHREGFVKCEKCPRVRYVEDDLDYMGGRYAKDMCPCEEPEDMFQAVCPLCRRCSHAFREIDPKGGYVCTVSTCGQSRCRCKTHKCGQQYLYICGCDDKLHCGICNYCEWPTTLLYDQRLVRSLLKLEVLELEEIFQALTYIGLIQPGDSHVSGLPSISFLYDKSHRHLTSLEYYQNYWNK